MSKNYNVVGVALLFSVLALGVPSADLQADQGRGRGAGKQAQKAKDVNKGSDKDNKNREVVVDRDGHVRVIREYARAGSLPPGLAKRESLPPGLQKQLRERGELPPGLQKRLVPVPGPLVSRLPALPAYYHRYFVGDDLIVVDTRSNQIAAIIYDVWR